MGGGNDSVAAGNGSSESKNDKNNDNRHEEGSGGGGSGGGDVGEGVTMNVRCSNGSKFSVQAKLDSTVGSFKSILATSCEIPAEQQRLIYKGRILKDDQTLESYAHVLASGGAISSKAVAHTICSEL